MKVLQLGLHPMQNLLTERTGEFMVCEIPLVSELSMRLRAHDASYVETTLSTNDYTYKNRNNDN